MAHCLQGLTSAQIEQAALTPITNLPDRAFFDITSAFLPEVDDVYFNDLTLQDAQAVQVRTYLLNRIMTTRAWERHVRERSTSTELHFGTARAVMLFYEYWSF